MKRLISKWLLALWGWKIKGIHPHEVDKAVCAVVPHTSWVDVPVGILVRNTMRADIRFLAKKPLFRFPYGGFMRWLGGYPVERRKNTNFVEAVVDIFNQHERFYISITPEGTRGKVHRLRSGYYWIAKQANIAIIMVSMDFENKTVTFHDPFFPTDDKDADMEYLESLVTGVKGKVPENSFVMKKAIED